MRQHRLKWASVAVVMLVLSLAGLYYLGSDNPHVQARSSAPQTVFVGEPFTITILMDNKTDAEQELVSIGVEQDARAQGLDVVSTLPSYRTIENEGAWTSYIFARRLRPTLSSRADDIVRLTLVAQSAGRYDTEIVLWFNNQLQGVFVSLEVEAIPHPTPWLGR